MARKSLDLTISGEGRDKGKVFRLTEMPASQAEEWGIRAFLALGISGFDIPKENAALGLAGVATTIRDMGAGIFQRIPFELLKPLLDEMMACVRSVQPKAPDGSRPLIEDDIEEVKTRLELRKQIIALHFDFFPSAGAQTSDQASAES